MQWRTTMRDLPDASRVTTTLTVSTTNNTQSFTYPVGTGPGNFSPTGNHKITGPSFTELLSKNGHITITFGASTITVVNKTERTFRAGDILNLDLDLAGFDADYDAAPVADGVINLHPVSIWLGAPDAADADGAVASQAATAAGGLATGINGALATGGVATFDVPRGVVAAWTGTSVLTVTGTDMDGNVLVESSASGTSMAGKKAFKTITGVSVSADVTGLTIGTSDVLGLPIFLETPAHVIREIEDGAVATAGTAVAGDSATATATTGDVRGTYNPNSAANGNTEFELLVLAAATSYTGVAQFGG